MQLSLTVWSIKLVVLFSSWSGVCQIDVMFSFIPFRLPFVIIIFHFFPFFVVFFSSFISAQVQWLPKPSGPKRTTLRSCIGLIGRACPSINLAETSVTIEGVVYVIDSGLVKVRAYRCSPRAGFMTCATLRKSLISSQNHWTKLHHTCFPVTFNVCVPKKITSRHFFSGPWLILIHDQGQGDVSPTRHSVSTPSHQKCFVHPSHVLKLSRFCFPFHDFRSLHSANPHLCLILQRIFYSAFGLGLLSLSTICIPPGKKSCFGSPSSTLPQ